MSAVSFPCYLGFPQWKSDLIVHEIVTVIKRQEATGKTNEILLAALGAVVSPLTKQMLTQEKCKLKRFVANAAADFEIVGHGGLEKVVFIGDEARLAPPAGVPAEMAQLCAKLDATTAGALDAEQVLEEIALTLEQCNDQTLFVSQIGARLRPETRKWLKVNSIKLLNFVQKSHLFTVDYVAGREKVTLCQTVSRKHSISSETATYVSDNSDLSCTNSANSYNTFSSFYVCQSPKVCQSPVATIHQLVKVHDPMSLAALLYASQPVVYED